MASITVSGATHDLYLDSPAAFCQLTATVEPDNASCPVPVWSSSAPDVASVDENGFVTALSSGTAIITASAADDSGVKAEFTLTVHDALTALTLPAGLLTVEEEAFAFVPAQHVVLPNGTKRIEARAFANMINLRLVDIPQSVSFIAEDAFSGTEQLIIIAPQNSYAARWAAGHNIPVLDDQ